MAASTSSTEHELFTLLSNPLILRQTAPYLDLPSLIRLRQVSRAFRTLLTSNPSAYAYLSLRSLPRTVLHLSDATSTAIDIGGQSFRAQRMDEALTEDEFYCGPLRGVFSRLSRPTYIDALRFVRTLVLDGLCVPAEMVAEIVLDGDTQSGRGAKFSALRTLSVRDCAHFNERKVCQVLKYAVRPGRAPARPGVKAVYVFGPRDGLDVTIGQRQERSSELGGVLRAEGAQIGADLGGSSGGDREGGRALGLPEDRWYRSMGRVLKMHISEWVETLVACEGIIAFDAVLCRGPRHDPRSGKDYIPPSIATVALGPAGCNTCGTCPEGPAIFGRADEAALPILAPPPLHGSTVKDAQRPSRRIGGTYPAFILRCEQCLRGRWCERCNKWWCEQCYTEPVSRSSSESTPATRRASDPESQATLIGSSAVERVPEVSAKVYLNVCVDSCLRSEILAVADGMWG